MPTPIKEIPGTVEGNFEFRPCLIVVAGRSLAGKTTASQNIARMTNFTDFDADDYRRMLIATMGKDPGKRLEIPEEIRIQTAAYTMMHRTAELHISKGLPVVISASYSQPHYRESLRRLQMRTGVHMRIFQLNLPFNQVLERLENRLANNDSSSTVRDIEQVRVQYERYTPITELPTLEIDTAKMPERNVALRILGSLGDLKV